MNANDNDLKKFYRIYNEWCKLAHLITNRLLEAMHEQFDLAGLDTALPFNGDASHYWKEKESETCHLNKGRIAWVKKML